MTVRDLIKYLLDQNMAADVIMTVEIGWTIDEWEEFPVTGTEEAGAPDEYVLLTTNRKSPGSERDPDIFKCGEAFIKIAKGTPDDKLKEAYGAEAAQALLDYREYLDDDEDEPSPE